MMKKLAAVCIVCCGIIVSLHAQEEPPPEAGGGWATGYLIHAAPISGQGIVDSAHMMLLIEGEVEAWNHYLHPARDEADFVISGMTGPYVPEDPEEADLYEGVYILYLQLYDNKTQQVLVEQNALYESVEELLEQFDQLMRNMFMNIAILVPEREPEYEWVDDLYPEAERWRQKILYLDGRVMWVPNYSVRRESYGEGFYLGGFGGTISASWHYLPFMAVELGVEVAYNEVNAARLAEFTDTSSLWAMTFPLAIKYIVIKPRNVAHLMFEFSAGAELNIPLQKDTIRPSPISAFGGFQYASKVGVSSAMILDVRVSVDLFPSKVYSHLIEKDMTYRRYMLHVGVGYKLGFIDRKTKVLRDVETGEIAPEGAKATRGRGASSADDAGEAAGE